MFEGQLLGERGNSYLVILMLQSEISNVTVGSSAAPQDSTIPTAAVECEAVAPQRFLKYQNLNGNFHQ